MARPMEEGAVRKQNLGEVQPQAESEPGRLERMALGLASPLGILIAFPSLVLALGVLVTLSSVRDMRDLARQRANESLEQRARHAEARLRSAFQGADALLDRVGALVHEHSSQAPIAPFAVRLRDLALHRPGLKWLSASYPDGSFQGVFTDARGKPRFQASWLEGARTRRQRFDFVGDRLELWETSEDTYDPRHRDFYRRAAERAERTWTEPYPFLPDFRTGISRVEPIYDAQGALQAVITADYDVLELSGILDDRDPYTRLVAFTASGAILALSRNSLEALPQTLSATRPVVFSELRDASLRTFFATRSGSLAPREFEVAGTPFVTVERVVRAGPDLEWRLAAVSTRDGLLADAHHQIRERLWTSLLWVIGAVALSGAFAVGMRRLRRARKRLEERARQALDQARDLGSYRLEAPIGTGGMGQVFRARHRMLARPAAIKLIRTDLPGLDASALEARFEREALALAKLRSPHTVSILDYGKSTDGRLFLVMELLDGLPLDTIVERFGPLSLGRVIPILVGACRSLAEAHEAGLIHRDIKPANLFLCHDGQGAEYVKVIDFGLAKQPRAAGITAEGSVSGTVEYMAPEQARGEAIDGRADLYSLGCTAFFLLTGRGVFRHTAETAQLLAHQSEPPPSLAACASQRVPTALDQIISRCLAKDPEYRPSSAASLARALTEVSIPAAQRSSPDSVREFWQDVTP